MVSASNRRDFEAVKRLLEQGANVDEKDENQQCALYRAAYRGHLQVAKLLLQYQAQVNSTNGLDSESALMAACETGHVNVARLL
ncbi:MAG: ankyrin repeat domain-containing protein, partial [Proteobacteria bacterium]|nr:ankyrin repeat domain-containing protein [Pseudomonadota bacterium]